MPIKPSGLHFDAAKGSLRVDLVNLTPMDCRFLRGVIDIFADPHKQALAGQIRRGTHCIRYSAGAARVCADIEEN
jgi:hypothetical protein